MTSGLLFVLLTLAGYRLARLIVADTIFDRQREWLKDRYPPTLERAKTQSTWNKTSHSANFRLRTVPGPPVSLIMRMAQCYWCLSVWVAAALVAAVQPWESTPLPVLWWAAVSTGIGVVAQVGG